MRFVIRHLDDVVALSGFVCIVYGVAQWSEPAAWVVAGVVLMAVAIGPHLRRGMRGTTR